MITLLLSTLCFANTIDRVTVFSDRAEVVRTTSVRCSGGSAQALFHTLPAALDSRTLRAESQRGNVIGVSFESVLLEQHSNSTIQQLLTEQQNLTAQIRQQQDLKVTHLTTLQQISAYENYFYTIFQEELRNPEINPVRWNDALNQIQEQRKSANKARLTSEQKLQILQRDLATIQQRLEKLAIQPSKQTLRATVSLTCTSQGSVNVDLFYVVPYANWQPAYDLRVTDTNNGTQDVSLQVSAQIRQSTGEDWNNAQIILSTAAPNLGAEAPYPDRITVYGALKEEQHTLIQSTEDRSSLKTGQQVSQTVASATLDDGGHSFQMTLPHRISIASDGHQYWVPIDQQKTTGRHSVISIPRGSPKAYDTVVFNNPAPYPLLSGTFTVQRNGTYMGQHSHSYTAPGEEMNISVGGVPHINIERTTLQDKRTTQLLGKEQRLQRAYQIQIHNNSQVETTLDVREAIPVSKNEKIRVQLDKTKTTGSYRFDEQQGFVVWTVLLKPQQTVSLDLFYHIYLPASWETY